MKMANKNAKKMSKSEEGSLRGRRKSISEGRDMAKIAIKVSTIGGKGEKMQKLGLKFKENYEKESVNSRNIFFV